MQTKPFNSATELFVVMVDYGDGRPQAIVDQGDAWSDVLAKVREALGDGNVITSVTHVRGGVAADRTIEALTAAVVEPELDETERHIIDWVRDHDRDARKCEAA